MQRIKHGFLAPAPRRREIAKELLWSGERRYCSARQIVASPHEYSRASSAMVSPAA
jgi:hypothetical protein